jgi:hypothetical protein
VSHARERALEVGVGCCISSQLAGTSFSPRSEELCWCEMSEAGVVLSCHGVDSRFGARYIFENSGKGATVRQQRGHSSADKSFWTAPIEKKMDTRPLSLIVTSEMRDVRKSLPLANALVIG